MMQAPTPGELVSVSGEEAAARLKRVYATARAFVERPSHHAEPHNHTRVAIVLLDELDAYAAKVGANDGDSSTSDAPLLSTTLGSLLDAAPNSITQARHVITIGCTNRPDAIDAALRRPGRFEREVDVRLPDADERARIVAALLGNRTDSPLEHVARKKCVGFSPADLVSAFREAAVAHAADSPPTSNGANERASEPTPAAFEAAVARTTATALRGRTVRLTLSKWEDVGGQEEAKHALRMAVEWPIRRRSALERFGLSRAFRGVLLYGPPGCAKTSLVRAAASEALGASAFFTMSGADVYSSGVGDAERAVRRLFADARRAAPALVFFDEIDALVGRRSFASSRSSDEVQARVLSTLLNELDGVEPCEGVVVAAATNRLDLVDEALLRPGRFDRLVFVGPPAPEPVLRVEIKRMGLLSCVDPAALAAYAPPGASGALLADACRAAALRAIREGRDVPTFGDFRDALSSHPST